MTNAATGTDFVIDIKPRPQNGRISHPACQLEGVPTGAGGTGQVSEAVEEFSDQRDFWYLKGRLLCELGCEDEGIVALENAERLDPNHKAAAEEIARVQKRASLYRTKSNAEDQTHYAPHA